MIRQLLKSKIHGATVTEANVDYEGSITIDTALMKEADIIDGEKVLIANLTNGARIESYTIPGEQNSGIICANGGAAHHMNVGDRILIMTFCGLDAEELKRHRAKVIHVDAQNCPTRTKYIPLNV